MTSAEMPFAQLESVSPVKLMAVGCALNAEVLANAIVKLVRWNAPETTSVICNKPVCGAAPDNTRMRTRAVPVVSVVVVTLVASVSGEPTGDVMNRKSPEMASKRTCLPTSGVPPCESVAATSASPPEQIDVPHAAAWLDVGVIVMVLLTVRGRTVNETVCDVPAESRTVSVTGVSALTALATTENEPPVSPVAFGMTDWSLDPTLSEPLPPLTRKVVGTPEYIVAVPGTTAMGPPAELVSVTPPLPHATSNDAAIAAVTRPQNLQARSNIALFSPWVRERGALSEDSTQVRAAA